MKVLCTVLLLSSMLFGQVLYEEHFTGGVMQLQWGPWFAYAGSTDSMQVISDPTTPEGDNWAGKITNESGGGAGATFAGTADMDDYSIEAYIYTTVTSGPGGPYNGITMRMDTLTHYYYRFISDFDSDGRLSLGAFEGGMGATILRHWTSGQIPGGVPSSSSWHKLKMRMVGDSVWCWYDDVLLPDCPIMDTANASAQGFFGVYVFNMVFTDSTKCDAIVVEGTTGISEYGSPTVNNVAAYPNPFSNLTTVSFGIEQSAKSIELKIYDAAGRLVRAFYPASGIVDHGSSVVWDGRDASGSVVAPGVYFITDGKGVQLQKLVKLH